MKGYFPRLIEQTGLTFGTGGNFKPGSLEPSPIRSERGDQITSIHIEERKLVEPRTGQVVKKIGGDVREGSEKSVPVSKVENIQHLRGKKLEGRVPEESQSRSSERGKLKHQKRNPQEKEFKVLDRDIQTSPQRDRPKHGIGAGESLERKETIARGASIKGHVQHTGKPSVSLKREFKEDSAFHPGAKSEDRISKEQIWQTTLKEVRDWVAETPTEVDAEIRNEDAGDTKKMGKKIPHFFDLREISTLSHIRPTESQAREEPEIHDFHLSIGTISLTIEEPQKEIRSSEPPQIGRETKLSPEANSSRLSRHYIRIR